MTFRVQKDILNYITRYKEHIQSRGLGKASRDWFPQPKTHKKKRERGGTSRSEFLNVNTLNIGSE